MAFNVQFGTVYKKHNSTFRGRAGAHDVTLSCVLKEETSVLNPSFFVDIAGTTIFQPAMLNHCYVSLFDRYYFIDNWTWERGRWRADCSIDVLASWKDSIGSSSQYILRSAAAGDGTIFDTMYPTKNVITTDYSNDTNPWNLYGGTYVVGTISGNGMGVGCVGYYALSSQQFRDLCNYLFGYVGTSGYFDVNEITKDMTMDTFKALYNPFQYICSAMYLPFSLTGMNPSQQNIDVGYWTIPVQGGRLVTISPYTTTRTLPWSGTHPDDNRGDYVYCNPYTRVDLDFQPFGHFQLPSDIIYARGGIELGIRVDTITGKGTCYIGGVVEPIMTVEAQVGVPIKLSQMATDYLAVASTVTQGVANTVGSALKGDIAGAISNAVSGVDSAIRSQVPTMSTMGNNGGFSALTQAPVAVFTYYSLVDEDIDRLGRPLCQIRTINTLPGYILCENAAVDTGGTSEENAKIQNLMNSGFYYE